VQYRAIASIILQGESMLTQHRKQQILLLLKKNGQVIAKDVSRSMDVSEDTIRRDLRELAQDGLLQRVHGGALPASPAGANFAAREVLRHEGKIAIGRAAAAMIRPGCGRPSQPTAQPLRWS
jgi:DeoR/GlpR family transcriptional regulator of sugar metabolism